MRNNAVPRKDLQKILLVNWSRFTAETIKVSNSVLITGVNGTGKSTVLDAVSYAVSGNRDFNSAAQDRDRSVRSYVRGDTKSSGAVPALRRGRQLYRAGVLVGAGERAFRGGSLR